MLRTVRLVSTYRVGERVPINGRYVCVPCGYRMHLAEGDVFPACIHCMRVSRPLDAQPVLGSEDSLREEVLDEFDDELVAENLELWELLEPVENTESDSDPHYRKN